MLMLMYIALLNHHGMPQSIRQILSSHSECAFRQEDAAVYSICTYFRDMTYV